MYDYTFLNFQISSRSDIRPHITEHPSSPLHLADVCCMFAVHSNKQWSNHWHKHIHTTTSVVHILKLRLIDGWAVIIFKLSRYLMVSIRTSRNTPDFFHLLKISLLQVTLDAIMLPSPLRNCQEDVDQFLLTLGNISEAAHPQAQAPNPSVSESLPQEVLDLLAVTMYTPEKIFSIVDVNIVTYISGYTVQKIRDKLCAVCQQRLMSSIDASKPYSYPSRPILMPRMVW